VLSIFRQQAHAVHTGNPGNRDYVGDVLKIYVVGILWQLHPGMADWV
jgi:hypothetical protein